MIMGLGFQLIENFLFLYILFYIGTISLVLSGLNRPDFRQQAPTHDMPI